MAVSAFHTQIWNSLFYLLLWQFFMAVSVFHIETCHTLFTICYGSIGLPYTDLTHPILPFVMAVSAFHTQTWHTLFHLLLWQYWLPIHIRDTPYFTFCYGSLGFPYTYVTHPILPFVMAVLALHTQTWRSLQDTTNTRHWSTMLG